MTANTNAKPPIIEALIFVALAIVLIMIIINS